MKEKITISICGVEETHIAAGFGAYATLCGLDGADDSPDVEQITVDTKKGAKVDCSHCTEIWRECKQWRKADFV